MLLRFGAEPRALPGMFTCDVVAGRVDELLCMERVRRVGEIVMMTMNRWSTWWEGVCVDGLSGSSYHALKTKSVHAHKR